MSLLDQFKNSKTLKSAEMVAQVKREPVLAKEVDEETGHTPLHFACCYGAPIAVVSALLDAFPGAASMLDKDGNTPLHFAAASKANVEVVKALIGAFPQACQMRGQANRLPLSLSFLYEAPPASVREIEAGFPEAMRDPCIIGDYRNHDCGLRIGLGLTK